MNPKAGRTRALAQVGEALAGERGQLSTLVCVASGCALVALAAEIAMPFIDRGFGHPLGPSLAWRAIGLAMGSLVVVSLALASGTRMFLSILERVEQSGHEGSGVFRLVRALWFIWWCGLCGALIIGAFYATAAGVSEGAVGLAYLCFLFFAVRYGVARRLVSASAGEAERLVPSGRGPWPKAPSINEAPVDTVGLPPMTCSLETSHCPVCGQDFSQRSAVFCGACRTPHHRDCWDFTGQCAVFGCAGLQVEVQGTGTV